jgi:tetrahydromethanopterin S-methyltransferase subunit C
MTDLSHQHLTSVCLICIFFHSCSTIFRPGNFTLGPHESQEKTLPLSYIIALSVEFLYRAILIPIFFPFCIPFRFFFSYWSSLRLQ